MALLRHVLSDSFAVLQLPDLKITDFHDWLLMLIPVNVCLAAYALFTYYARLCGEWQQRAMQAFPRAGLRSDSPPGVWSLRNRIYERIIRVVDWGKLLS